MVLNIISSGVIESLTLMDYDFMCVCFAGLQLIVGTIMGIALLKCDKKKSKNLEEVSN